MEKTKTLQHYMICEGEYKHDYPQILLPLNNTLKVVIDDKIFQISPREMIFIPRRMSRVCNYHGSLMAINLSEDIVVSKEIFLLFEPIVISMQEQVGHLVSLIQAETRENPNSASIRYLYSYLASKIIENCIFPSIKYMSENYFNPITVDELAKIEGYNTSYYNDWFKKHTGLSPTNYLRHLRIDKGKELLINSKFDVTEISTMVGYSSNSTFTRAFTEIERMTPREYRNANKKKNKEMQ